VQTSQHAEYAIRTCARLGRSVEEADVVRANNELTHTGQVWPHLVSREGRRGWDSRCDVHRRRLTPNGSFNVRLDVFL
jgi:hypothetical protein